MTKNQKEVNKKIRALNRLAGLFKANGSTKVHRIKGYLFVGKTV